MNECWPSRSSSFLRSTLCSELWSWQGEGDRHTVATGKSACFDVETVVEIDGVKVGPTRSHATLRNMRMERSTSSQTPSASSDSSTSFGSSADFELALVFEKPGRYTLPILDITRIRWKYLHQGKASIEARDLLFVLTAASQNELEMLLEVIRDVKAVKMLGDSRLCTSCKEKGELKKKKRKQKRELQLQEPPTDSEPTSWLDGECQATKKQKLKVLECVFRKKSLPSLVDTDQEHVYCIRDLLKSKELGSRNLSKMGMPLFEGGDSIPIPSVDEVYHTSISQEDMSSENSMFYDCERQSAFGDEIGYVAPILAVPDNSTLVVEKLPRLDKRKSSGKRNGGEGLRAVAGAMAEKENLDVFAGEDLQTIGDMTVNRFAQRRGMNEVMRKVQEEQRRVKEEKRRKDERRKIEVDERRESEEREKMFQRKETLRKLLEQERKWKDDLEAKREEERRWKEEEDVRKLKADEERLKKSLERRLQVEDRLRKEEKKKEEERRRRFMEIRFQEEEKRRKDEEDRSQKEEKRKEVERRKEEDKRKRRIEKMLQEDEKRRKDEEDRRIKELKQREEQRKLQEQKLREEEQKLREQKLREEERKLQEQKLREEKLREEERKLQEQKLREEERKLQEQKLREEERKLHEQKLREEEQQLREQQLREEERKLQEQKKREGQRKSLDQTLREEEYKRINEVERRLQELKQSDEEDKQFKEVLRKLHEQIEEQLQEQRKEDEEKTQETMNFFKQEDDRQKLREHEELRKFQDSVKTTNRLSHRFRRSRVSAEARMSPKEVRKILEEQLDRLDPWKLDEDMKRWRSEENDRLGRKVSSAMPDHERSILEEQRKREEAVMKMSQRLKRTTSGRVKDDAEERRNASGRTEDTKGQSYASAEVNGARDNSAFQSKCSQDRTFLDHLFGSWGNPSPGLDSDRLGKGRESFKPTETFLKPDRLRQEELRKAELERKKAEKAADEERKRLSQERIKAAKLEAKRLDKLLKEAQRRAKAEERQRQEQKAREQASQKTAASLCFSRAHYLTYRQYEDAWTMLKTSGQKTFLAYSNIPWPPHSNPLFVEEADSLAAQRRKLRIALLRWHPDKFQSLCGNRLSPLDKDSIEAQAKTVAQEVIVWKSKLDNMS